MNNGIQLMTELRGGKGERIENIDKVKYKIQVWNMEL